MFECFIWTMRDVNGSGKSYSALLRIGFIWTMRDVNFILLGGLDDWCFVLSELWGM